MKFTGKLKEPVIDYITGKITALIEINEDFRQAYEELKDYKLDIEIKKYRKKRSLDANSFYWLLISKLAKILDTSLPELHNLMLSKYGYIEILEDKPVFTLLVDTEETEKKVKASEYYHLKPTSQVTEMADGKLWRTYMLMRGSSTYNTEEMSRLISGLITDCKEAGIPDREIATPDEQRILKEKYNIEL